jgi:hypothetical protein
MARKENLRVELDDKMMPSDRRVTQVKGDIDVSGLDADDLAHLREEDITNLNPDELDLLEAELGIARGTEDGGNLVPSDALHRDLEAADAIEALQYEKAANRELAKARPQAKRQD